MAAYPASAIPWDEVGPGWFLLTNDPDAGNDVWPQEGSIGRFPVLDDAVQLVSPTGDLYYVRDLTDMGNGYPVEWTGDALTILDGTFYSESDDIPHGPLTALDLASGAARVVNPMGYMPYFQRTLPNGNIVTQWGAEGSLNVEVLTPELTVVTTICQGEGTATSVSPDGTRVVCLVPASGGGSDVMLYKTTGGVGSHIDTFKYDPWWYSTSGWWDNNSFVVGRWTDDGTNLVWTHDVTTAKIGDLTPRMSDGTLADSFAGAGGYRILVTDHVAEVVGFDGVLRATLPCAPTAISGHTALAVCGLWDGGQIDVVVANLDTGNVTSVASFLGGEYQDIKVYPYPGGEETGLY